MAIKNLIAGGIGFSPGSVKFIPTLGFGSALELWFDKGIIFTYTISTQSLSFEATMLAITGTIKARVYNVTDSAAVASSEVSTTSATKVVVRTASSITLTNAKKYIHQFGVVDGDAGVAFGGALVNS